MPTGVGRIASHSHWDAVLLRRMKKTHRLVLVFLLFKVVKYIKP